jgi:hypothetical protein
MRLVVAGVHLLMMKGSFHPLMYSRSIGLQDSPCTQGTM